MTNLLQKTGWYRVEGKGLTVDRKPSFREYDKTMCNLAIITKLTPLIIGDLLIYGENVFGERFAQVTEHFDEWQYGTLGNYKWVCGNVPQERRIEGLNYAHYRAVASLSAEDQTKYLTMAAEEDLSGAELYRLLNDSERDLAYYINKIHQSINECIALAETEEQAEMFKLAYEYVGEAHKLLEGGDEGL